MLVAENDEITTLSSIARDDVVVHHDWTATKQMQRDRLARRAKDTDLKKMGTVSFSLYFKKRGAASFLERYLRCQQIL